jgi:DMSO/TMAO reductase YedYZ heme-binding membrane subunit
MSRRAMSAVSGLTYWSGVWATAILLMALAVTPAATISRWPALLDVRRMIGVTALAYTIAYVAIYFAFRLELCIHRQRDGDETYSDLATLSTIGRPYRPAPKIATIPTASG